MYFIRKKVDFSLRTGAVVFDGIFSELLLPLRNFCDPKLLKGNLFTFSLEKVARGNAVRFFSNFPAKSQFLNVNFFLHMF